MRIKVLGGYLEVEMEKDVISDIQDKLNKLAQDKVDAAKEDIKTAGLPMNSSKNPKIGKLGMKPRMPI